MSGAEEQRRTEQGELIWVRTLRGFLKRVLADDAVADKVDELLFEHMVAGCYHPSVVAESLPGFLNDIIASAEMRDWQAIADELIAEVREVDGEV
jgi:hypothetical protein